MASETENTIKEILDDLIPAMEAVEAQSTAVLRFLKENGIASEAQLQPYLEQGADTSNVKWRAVRVRMERLLNSAIEAVQKAPEKKLASPAPQAAEEKKPGQETGETGKSSAQEVASEEKKDVSAVTEAKTSEGKTSAPTTNPKREDSSDKKENEEAA